MSKMKFKQSFILCIIITFIVAMFPGAVGAEENNEEIVSEIVEEETDSEASNDEEDGEDSGESNEEEESGSNEEELADAIDEEDISEESTDEEESTANLQETTAENEEETSTLAEAHDPDLQKEQVQAALELAKEYIEDNQPTYDETNIGSHSEYWIFSSLRGASYNPLKTDFPWGDSSPWSEGTYWTNGKDEQAGTANEEAGIIISTIMLGMNPRQFGERDVVADLLEREKENGLYSTIWGEPWIFIALDVADADYDREKHIRSIVAQQSDDGMFGNDIDTTGWMMMALAPHADTNPDAAEAIEKSKEWAYELFLENDELQGPWGPNATTTAAVIMGLAAIGEDVYGEKWTNEQGSLVEQLLAYQQDDGYFWWEKEQEGAPRMAFDQSFFALVTVVNEESIFVGINNDPVEDPGEEDPTPNPDPTPDPDPTPNPEEIEDSNDEDEEPTTEEVEETPVEQTEENVEQDDDKEEVTAVARGNDDGKRLPDTATNMYNIMVIGFLFIVIGVVVAILRKKNFMKRM